MHFIIQGKKEDLKSLKEITDRDSIMKFFRGALLAIIESLAKFAKKLPEFKKLDLNDQVRQFSISD